MSIQLFTLSNDAGNTAGLQLVADTESPYADLCELILQGFDCLAAPSEAQRAIRDVLLKQGLLISEEQEKSLKVKPFNYRVYRPAKPAEAEAEAEVERVKAAPMDTPVPSRYTPTPDDIELCRADRTCGDYLYRARKTGEEC